MKILIASMVMSAIVSVAVAYIMMRLYIKKLEEIDDEFRYKLHVMISSTIDAYYKERKDHEQDGINTRYPGSRRRRRDDNKEPARKVPAHQQEQ